VVVIKKTHKSFHWLDLQGCHTSVDAERRGRGQKKEQSNSDMANSSTIRITTAPNVRRIGPGVAL
jgi:hypothetical protein